MKVLKYPTLKIEQTEVSNDGYIPQLTQIEERLKHTFKNKNLIVQAFTHKTFE